MAPMDPYTRERATEMGLAVGYAFCLALIAWMFEHERAC